MRDDRKQGYLIFRGPNIHRTIDIYWELLEGELLEGGRWRLAVSFAKDFFSFPHETWSLLSMTINDLSVSIFLSIDKTALPCVIYEIEDYPDQGIVEIADPSSSAFRWKQ